MSDPMRILCRTCDKAVCGPDGMYQDELQYWFDFRHTMAKARSSWPGSFDHAPKIDRDDEEHLTDFICEHKDHDLCITDPYEIPNKKRKVYEFKKEKNSTTQPRRCFRELKNREGFTSDIMEIDEAPRLYHSIIKHHKKIDWGQCESSVSVTATPYGTVRFVYYKEELVLLRTYLEE